MKLQAALTLAIVLVPFVGCKKKSSSKSNPPAAVSYPYFMKDPLSCHELSQQYVDLMFGNDAEKMKTFNVELGSCPEVRTTEIDGQEQSFPVIGYCLMDVFGPQREVIYQRAKYEGDKVQECKDNGFTYVAK